MFELLNEPTKSSDTPTPVTEQKTEDNSSIDEIADKLQQAVDEKNGVQPTQKQNSLSPLYSRYIAVQEQYPDCIVLIRLGDFYETFDDDATTLADELSLTLTGREVGLESRAPMVGFPHHTSDAYIQKIRERHGVVIVENGNVVTLSRIVQKNGKTVDADTGEILDCEDDEPEELTESEMRQFDGDIQEPKDLDSPKSVESDEQPATFSPSSFNEDTAIYLLKLLDGKMDLA